MKSDMFGRSINECNHSPREKSAKALMHYFLWKVGLKRHDKVSFSCFLCGAPIIVPRGYYQKKLKIWYCLASAFLTWIGYTVAYPWTVDIPLGKVYFVIFVLLINRIGMRLIDGFIFSIICFYGRWKLVASKNTRKQMYNKNEYWLFWDEQQIMIRLERLGVWLALFIATNHPLLILLLVDAICFLILRYINKKPTSTAVCIICIAIIFVSLTLIFIYYYFDQPFVFGVVCNLVSAPILMWFDLYV